MRLSRRGFVEGIAALVLAPVARAASPEATDEGAAAPIRALNQALIGAMKAGEQTPFGQRFAALAPVVDQTFDLPAILRSSIGLRWRTIDPAEQQQLGNVFRKFTVCSYTANFKNFNGERIEVVPGGRAIGADQIVPSKITSASDSTSIDYLMHRGANGWRAIDVLLNGSISQVALNRSDWSSMLSVGGGGAAALGARLQSKVTELSGGAIS